MRELILVSGVICMGYLAERSVRSVVNETSRIYVENSKTMNSREIFEDIQATVDAENMFIGVTASNHAELSGNQRL